MSSPYTISRPEDIAGLERELVQDFEAVDMLPFLGEIKTDLEELHKNYFLSETGPGGNAWAPNAPATVARKGHGDVLQDTLAMMRAMTATGAPAAVREIWRDGDRDRLIFGVNPTVIPYWVYHDQPGGELPWRPFIGITDAEAQVIASRAADAKLQGMVQANQG